MRAMVIAEPGGPEVLQIQEVAGPGPADDEVLLRVKAFGVNHADTHMRKGEWPEATPISGIEAVGTVVADPSGVLAEGTKVLAIMGGVLRDSLQAVGVRGRVYQAGFLGGLGPVADFLPIVDLPSGVQFS